MNKKLVSSLMAFILTLLSSFQQPYLAKETDFSQWAPWSFYASGGWNYGDTSDAEYFVPVIPSYRSSNNIKPGLLASPGENLQYMYIRPEYEWNVQIAEHIKDRASFYFKNSEKANSEFNEIVVGFTVPEDGIYNLYANVINDYGNEKIPDGAVLDGGTARVTVLTGGQTIEEKNNSEDFALPAGGQDVTEEAIYEKNGVSLLKNDKIFLKLTAGESGEDVFQAVWRISKIGSDGKTERVYDLRDLVDNAGEDVADGVQNVIDSSVQDYDENAASAESDDSNVRLLANLGIIDESEIGSYLLNKEITRAEFAYLVARLMNYKDVQNMQTESRYFTDVNAEHKPYIIDALADEGIIAKARMFRPDDLITVSEAAVMSITVLGYEKYARSYGGYPEGYIKQAKAIDILPDGVVSGTMLRSSAAAMIADMLDVYVLDINSVAGDETILNNHSKETILSKRHDIYSAEGVITKIPYGTLHKGAPGMENKAWIDDEEYESSLELDGMLGYKVEFYYHKGKNANTLLYVIPSKKSGKIILNSADIENISYDEVIYSADKRNVRLKIDRMADFLYNSNAGGIGGKLENYINSDSVLHLLDRDGDGDYDVVDIRTYTNYIVDFVNKKDNEIIEKISQNTISFETADSVIFKGADGSSASFEDIESGMVVSVFETLDKSSMQIVLSDTSAAGNVTGKEAEEKYIYYMLDGKKYRIADNYYDICSGEIEIGCETVFYLDAFGAVAYAKPDFSDRFGYLMKVSCENQDTDTLLFKIVTSGGETVNYKISSKVEYNGADIKENDIYTRIENEYPDESYQGIIQYKAAGGKLKKITMPDKLNSVYYKETLKYHSGTGIIGGKMVADENTLVFQMPDELGRSRGVEPIVQKAKSYFVHFANYAGLTAVKLDNNSIVADVILMTGSKSKALDVYQYPLLIKSLSPYIDENDEERIMVTGYRNGQLVKYNTESDITLKNVSAYTKTASEGVYDVDVGDIILTTLDNDTITYAEIDFDASTKTKLGPNPYTDYFGRPRLYYVGVYSKQGQYLKIASDPASVADDSNLEIQGINKVYIIDLNKNKDKVTEGSYADIIPYKSRDVSVPGGNDAYTRAVFSTMEKPDAIYIYR